MSMVTPRTFSLPVAALASLCVPALAAVTWMTDADAARAKAGEEGKLVLADFTGSDWCGWCIRLRRDVLDTAEFEQYIANKFVALEVDVPQNPDFPAEQKQKNEALCKQYNVTGFPTVLVFAPDGTVVGGFSGGRPGTDAVVGPLNRAAENAAAYDKARSMTDPEEQLKALGAVYRAIPGEVRENAEDLRRRILEKDANDVTGLRAEAAAEDQQRALAAEMKEARTLPRMLAVVDSYLNADTLIKANEREFTGLKVQILLSMAETAEDVAQARDLSLKSAESDPNMTPAQKARLETFFADTDKILERAKDIRARMPKE